LISSASARAGLSGFCSSLGQGLGALRLVVGQRQLGLLQHRIQGRRPGLGLPLVEVIQGVFGALGAGGSAADEQAEEQDQERVPHGAGW